ncbi:MAG TPA: ABC transporter permease [Thermoanaerobaculia bacterium]
MPDWSAAVRERLAGLRLDPARESALVEELAQHASDRYEELVTNGANAAEAERAILAELDSPNLVSKLRPVLPRPAFRPSPEPADASGFAGFWLDLRHGVRRLRLEPAFAAVAVLSLALGIGANTAIFQLLDAVCLRSLPVERPQELVSVRVVNVQHGRTGDFSGRFPHLTYALWERLEASPEPFSGIAAWGSERLNLARGGEARWAETLWVSGSYFDLLGVRPLSGRLLTRSDDRPGCASPGAVVSETFWRRELGARPPGPETTLTLNGHPFEVVGVAPRAFTGLDVGRDFDVAIPICANPLVISRPRVSDSASWWLASVGRLKPGWTPARADAYLKTIAPAIFRATLSPRYDAQDARDYLAFGLGTRPVPTGFSSLRTDYQSPLWLLLGISGLVLVIACANLANLMVARATARRREIAIRLALGASRRRLVRQLLAESLVLAVLGAAAGAVLAQTFGRFLLSFLATYSARWFVNLAPDWRLFAFTAGLAALTALLFGLLPAIQAAGTRPNEALKSGGRGVTGGAGGLASRRALVVCQVSLSLVLLVGALLFVRTLRNLLTLDPGFRRTQILAVSVDFWPLRLAEPARVPFKHELLERVRAIPGVEAASTAWVVPSSGDGWNENVSVEGSGAQRQTANFNRVSGGYFRTMGTPLLAGRDFREADRAGSEPVAIVTETFVRKFLNGASPIGRSIRIDGAGRPDRHLRVVGLVKDSKYYDLREDFTPIIFVPDAQDDDFFQATNLLIRSPLRMDSVTASVKNALTRWSPELVLGFQSHERMVREGLIRERLMASLSAFFGFLAALLATIGLYGVVSFMVVKRRNEIGVRMAMGADRGDIVRMVLREAGALFGVGLAIGAVLAVAAAHAAKSLFFGLRPTDPVTLLMAVGALAAVAAAASVLPARRAASLDPVTALRED